MANLFFFQILTSFSLSNSASVKREESRGPSILNKKGIH